MVGTDPDRPRCPGPRTCATPSATELWDDLVERPIGELIERTVADDTVRGILLTDALIGTFASAHSPELRRTAASSTTWSATAPGSGRCRSAAWARWRRRWSTRRDRAGAELRTGAEVVGLEPYDGGVDRPAGRRRGDQPPGRCWPTARRPTLAGLLGRSRRATRRAPRSRSTSCSAGCRRSAPGSIPQTGFAGTLHLHQGYASSSRRTRTAAAGRIPDPLPCESYCHSLTDPSIVAPDLREQGFHTLTIFGLHTPARLFEHDHDAGREQALQAALASLQSVLAEPLTDCIARDAHGDLCIEVMSPAGRRAGGSAARRPDLPRRSRLALAGRRRGAGHPGRALGGGDDHPAILLCGSGARRGGAVSGLGGHNAAMALLEERGLSPVLSR